MYICTCVRVLSSYHFSPPFPLAPVLDADLLPDGGRRDAQAIQSELDSHRDDSQV